MRITHKTFGYSPIVAGDNVIAKVIGQGKSLFNIIIDNKQHCLKVALLT